MKFKLEFKFKLNELGASSGRSQWCSMVVRGAAAQVGTATRVATAPLERARANE